MNSAAHAAKPCLAPVLKRRFAAHKHIDILMYSSREAVENLDVPPLTESCELCEKWQAQNYAYYFFDADKREEHIDLTPIGSTGTLTTTINLPATSPPVCTVNMSGRCLLALDEVDYPAEAWRTSES